MRLFPVPLAEGDVGELPPVRLLLDAGTRILVAHSKGHPLSAAVYALPGEHAPWSGLTENGWRVASRFGWVASDGTISLPRADGELLDLYVNPLGTARIVRALDMEQARFVLPDSPGRTLEVEVTAAGSPVADAIVAVGDIAWPVGLTDAHGRLTVPGVRRRVLSLVVLSEDGAVARRTVDLAAQPPGHPVELRLPAARQITGKVVDGAGRAVPGALVWLGVDPGRSSISGPKGELRLPVATGGRFWIQGHAQDHLPGLLWVDPGAETADRLVLRLDRAQWVEGQTIDEAGEPLGGVAVGVTMKEPSADPAFRRDPLFARVRSDAGGRFRVGVRRGQGYVFEGSRLGYRTVQADLDTSSETGAESGGSRGAAGDLELVLRLARHHGAWGRVLDWRRHPAAGVTVWLLPAGSRDRMALETRGRRGNLDPKLSAASDPDGVFRLEHLPAPEIDLVAYGPGLAPAVVLGIRAGAGQEGAVDLGTVVLRQGVELAGGVVDNEGHPIEDASVWLLDPGESIARQKADPAHKREPECRTARDGSFRLSDLAPRTAVRLGVNAEGYQPSVVDLEEVGGSGHVRIVLTRQGLLSGRVLDPDDLPVAGARVLLTPADDPAGVVGERLGMDAERSTKSDEDGIFELDELEGGTYRLEAYGDGFLSSDLQTMDVVPGSPVEDVELHLRRGASVEGQVLTDAGEPVEGAVVLFGRPAARTGADGSFLVEGVEPGPTTVEVRHPDFAWHQETREIEPGDNVLDVRLHAGASVSGRTLGSAGEALQGVSIRLIRQTKPYREYATQSGPGGTFRIPSAEEGRYLIEADGGAQVPVDPDKAVDVGPDGVDDLLIEFRPGATIRGTIQGLEVDELSRVRVVATTAARHSRRGRVDHSGTYRVEPVAPAVWWLRASLPGGGKEAEARVVVDEDATEVTANLDMSSGLALRGVVLIDGEPSSGVQVSLTGLDRTISRQARSDLEGRFEIATLREGRYRLTASDSRTSLIHNEVVSLFGEQDITIRIESAKVQGLVTSEATGEPVQDAVVTLGQLEGASGVEVSRVTLATDAGGGFRVSKLSAGRYRLDVHHDGYAPRVSEVWIQAGESIDLDLTLAPTDGLRLRIHGAGGVSPPWATVRLFDPQSGRSIEETRPLDGDLLAIPTVPSGLWEVVLAAPSGALAEVRVMVPGEPIDVVLPPAGRLRLQAPVLENLGLEAIVQVLDRGGHPISALDLETGRLRSTWAWRRDGVVIDGVPAGQWIVRIEASNGSTWVRDVSTSGGGEALVVVQ